MYGKIFASMFEGSMVGAGPVIYSVWAYCIAKADIDGTVLLNPALLASIIGTSRVEVESALEYLQSPDPHSKNPDNEGRRLLHQTGHLYFIVSFEVYRDIKNNEDRREYMREYMRKRREREDVNSLQSLQKLQKVYPASASVSASVSAFEDKEGGCKGEEKEPPVIFIPLAGNKEFPIYQPIIDEWETLYPNVDIIPTLREIRGWNIANPTRKKTKTGVMKHINSWLAKEQNKG